MKNNFDLIKFQLRKKTNILTIIIIGIFISIALLNNIYNASMSNMTKDIAESKEFRSFNVYKDDNDEKLIDELKSINHVINATPAYEYLGYALNVDTFITSKLNGEFGVTPASNESLPKIVKGTDFPDDDGYYMVCPQNFYPTSGEMKYMTIFDKFPVEKYLNKEISIQYYGQKYGLNHSSDYIFNMNIKLIGLYKNNDYNIDENKCYVNSKVMHDYVLNYYKDLEEEYKAQKSLGFIIEVDSKKNINHVENKLKEYGYTYEPLGFIVEEEIEETNNNTQTLIYILLLIIVIFIFVVLEKDYIENRDYYKLLIVVGYDNKRVKLIYMMSSLLKIAFCVILGLIISAIICGLAYLFLKICPFWMFKYRIVIPFELIYIILIFLILPIIMIIFNSFLHFKKVGKYE